MPQLTKYQRSPIFEADLIKTGFDPRDPNLRHPVQNKQAEAILALVPGNKKPQLSKREQALLQARSGPGNQQQRVLSVAPLAVLPTIDLSALTIPVLDPVHVAIAISALWLAVVLSVVLALALSIRNSFTLRKVRKTMTLITKQTDPNLLTLDFGSDEGASAKNLSNRQPVQQLDKFRWLMDGATRQGTVRSENQDAFHVHRFSPSRGFALVCDGMGGMEGGRLASQTTVDVLSCYLEEVLSNPKPLHFTKLIEQGVDMVRRKFDQDGLKGATTLIVIYFDEDQLTYATLGDGGLKVVWPGGMVGDLLAPHHVYGQPSNIISGFIGHENQLPVRIGTVRMEPDTTVLAMSDGVSEIVENDAIAEQQAVIVRALKTEAHPICDQVLETLEVAREPDSGMLIHNDNMTLVVAHLEAVDQRGLD